MSQEFCNFTDKILIGHLLFNHINPEILSSNEKLKDIYSEIKNKNLNSLNTSIEKKIINILKSKLLDNTTFDELKNKYETNNFDSFLDLIQTIFESIKSKNKNLLNINNPELLFFKEIFNLFLMNSELIEEISHNEDYKKKLLDNKKYRILKYNKLYYFIKYEDYQKIFKESAGAEADAPGEADAPVGADGGSPSPAEEEYTEFNDLDKIDILVYVNSDTTENLKVKYTTYNLIYFLLNILKNYTQLLSFILSLKYFKNFRLSKSELLKETTDIDKNIEDIVNEKNISDVVGVEKFKGWISSFTKALYDYSFGSIKEKLKKMTKEMIFNKNKDSNNIIHYFFAYYYWDKKNTNLFKNKNKTKAVTGGAIITGTTVYIFFSLFMSIIFYLCLCLVIITFVSNILSFFGKKEYSIEFLDIGNFITILTNIMTTLRIINTFKEIKPSDTPFSIFILKKKISYIKHIKRFDTFDSNEEFSAKFNNDYDKYSILIIQFLSIIKQKEKKDSEIEIEKLREIFFLLIKFCLFMIIMFNNNQNSFVHLKLNMKNQINILLSDNYQEYVISDKNTKNKSLIVKTEKQNLQNLKGKLTLDLNINNQLYQDDENSIYDKDKILSQIKDLPEFIYNSICNILYSIVGNEILYLDDNNSLIEDDVESNLKNIISNFIINIYNISDNILEKGELSNLVNIILNNIQLIYKKYDDINYYRFYFNNYQNFSSILSHFISKLSKYLSYNTNQFIININDLELQNVNEILDDSKEKNLINLLNLILIIIKQFNENIAKNLGKIIINIISEVNKNEDTLPFKSIINNLKNINKFQDNLLDILNIPFQDINYIFNILYKMVINFFSILNILIRQFDLSDISKLVNFNNYLIVDYRYIEYLIDNNKILCTTKYKDLDYISQNLDIDKYNPKIFCSKKDNKFELFSNNNFLQEHNLIILDKKIIDELKDSIFKKNFYSIFNYIFDPNYNNDSKNFYKYLSNCEIDGKSESSEKDSDQKIKTINFKDKLNNFLDKMIVEKEDIPKIKDLITKLCQNKKKQLKISNSYIETYIKENTDPLSTKVETEQELSGSGFDLNKFLKSYQSIKESIKEDDLLDEHHTLNQYNFYIINEIISILQSIFKNSISKYVNYFIQLLDIFKINCYTTIIYGYNQDSEYTQILLKNLSEKKEIYDFFNLEDITPDEENKILTNTFNDPFKLKLNLMILYIVDILQNNLFNKKYLDSDMSTEKIINFSNAIKKMNQYNLYLNFYNSNSFDNNRSILSYNILYLQNRYRQLLNKELSKSDPFFYHEPEFKGGYNKKSKKYLLKTKTKVKYTRKNILTKF